VSGIDDMLDEARGHIARYSPAEALAATDAVLVDLRGDAERAHTGIIPGSVHVPGSVLQWRCDPDCGWSNPVVADRGRTLILVCAHGFSSSLAAASLAGLGFERVGDLAGGFEGWAAAGMPVVPAPAPEDGLPGMGGPQQ
jgi:rhodanese-related sulfurtransferase